VIALPKFNNTFKGVCFPYPAWVAGGIFKTSKQMIWALKHHIIGEWGSIETEASNGNGGRDYFAHYVEVGGVRVLMYTQNSRGIPNPGMTYIEERFAMVYHEYEDANFPLILNVSGKNVADTLELMWRAAQCGFKVVVVSGACPNKGNQPILCYDQEAVSELFERAEKEIGPSNVIFLWKVSTGMPRPILAHNRMCVGRSKVFDGIVTGNAVPNTFDYLPDGTTTIMTDKHGLIRGAMAGPAILPMALDHTQFCSCGIPSKKIVVGCGGISGGESGMKHMRAGASFVQTHSAFRESGEDPDFMRELNRKLFKRLEQVPAAA